MYLYLYVGESGKKINNVELTLNGCTKPILELLKRGIAVEIWEEKKPLKNYKDKFIQTDSDGFACPVKKENKVEERIVNVTLSEEKFRNIVDYLVKQGQNILAGNLLIGAEDYALGKDLKKEEENDYVKICKELNLDLHKGGNIAIGECTVKRFIEIYEKYQNIVIECHIVGSEGEEISMNDVIDNLNNNDVIEFIVVADSDREDKRIGIVGVQTKNLASRKYFFRLYPTEYSTLENGFFRMWWD